jgi:hypothetical protein
MTTKTACDFEIAMSELAEAQTALQHEFGRAYRRPPGTISPSLALGR